MTDRVKITEITVISRADKIDAEIESLKEAKKLAKLEAWFVKKKLDGTLTTADRYKLSDARVDYRLNHRRPATGAAVESIGAKASQGKVG